MIDTETVLQDEETKTHFEFGDDIPEKPERIMIDQIGEPVFLCKFPRDLKAFYMKRDDTDPSRVDLLLPSVEKLLEDQ